MAKAKGTAMVDLVKALRRSKPKALTLLTARLHHYLEERLVSASWYPLEYHDFALPGFDDPTPACA